jgi:hypothetical protein
MYKLAHKILFDLKVKFINPIINLVFDLLSVFLFRCMLVYLGPVSVSLELLLWCFCVHAFSSGRHMMVLLGSWSTRNGVLRFVGGFSSPAILRSVWLGLSLLVVVFGKDLGMKTPTVVGF